MKFFLFLILNLFICQTANSIIKTDSLLNELSSEVGKEDLYLKAKYQKIDYITKQLKNERNRQDIQLQLMIYQYLYNEYKSFIYDSAFKYALKIQQLAFLSKDNEKITLSKIDMGFILISSGMFKEAFDTLKLVNMINMSDSIKFEYYSLMARAYLDLVGYDANSYYDLKYKFILNQYIDSAISLCEINSPNYLYYKSLKNTESGNLLQAGPIFEELINHYKLDNHLYAMASSGLAYIYLNQGQTDKAIKTLTDAIKADIQSCTKETLAADKLAEILYSQGYIKQAYFYIKLAMDDASFYKANLRKTQIASILPVIEDQALHNAESQKRRLFHYSIATTSLSILVVVFLLLTYFQMRRLYSAKKIITHSNDKLQESNKIKDEYIGYYFNSNAEFIEKIEKFIMSIKRMLLTKRYGDIDAVINRIDLQRERETLFLGFDKVFLKLFPDFVQQFNLLLKEEERIILKENQLLNTDLRIFALIRIGINDHEKIAKIMGYSISTIYNYKTRIRNKSIIPHEKFEEEVMKIKTI